jgi:SAM-dependent methyltransferase
VAVHGAARSNAGGSSRGAAAATWDHLAARYHAQERFEAHAVDVALRLAAIAPGERLVDLGTGTAVVLRRLAAAPRRPLEAIGVDRSAGMLAHVGALPHGWSTMCADARDVPLPDGWADVAICSYVLQVLDCAERGEVLAEARRLLRPGPASRLVVVTPWVDERRAWGRLVAGVLRRAASARPAAYAGLRPVDASADLAAAGFAVTRRVVLPRRGYPSLVAEARHAAAPRSLPEP